MPDDAASGFTVSDEPSETMEETVARLAAMQPLEYDRVRESEAKRLQVRVATLDKEVAKKRGRPRLTQAELSDWRITSLGHTR